MDSDVEIIEEIIEDQLTNKENVKNPRNAINVIKELASAATPSTSCSSPFTSRSVLPAITISSATSALKSAMTPASTAALSKKRKLKEEKVSTGKKISKLRKDVCCDLTGL